MNSQQKRISNKPELTANSKFDEVSKQPKNELSDNAIMKQEEVDQINEDFQENDAVSIYNQKIRENNSQKVNNFRTIQKER